MNSKTKVPSSRYTFISLLLLVFRAVLMSFFLYLFFFFFLFIASYIFIPPLSPRSSLSVFVVVRTIFIVHCSGIHIVLVNIGVCAVCSAFFFSILYFIKTKRSCMHDAQLNEMKTATVYSLQKPHELCGAKRR